MPRKSLAILISGTLVFAHTSTGAWSAEAASRTAHAQTTQTVPAKNESPLPPGGTATIKEAQGAQRVLVGLGLAGAFVALAWLVLDDDEEAVSTGT